ncbi:MAG: hypothetical protein IKS45_08110, partial [Thermoguttaceae bacterium]|nr:hypothetical protein [Thermoguttaceae bacterium]
NLFFKKGRRGAAPNPRCRARRIITAPVGRFFPHSIKLEKTSLKGSQLAGDLSFFKVGDSPPKFISRKERKEMKDGWRAGVRKPIGINLRGSNYCLICLSVL